jgi:hypothetical protein
MITLLKHIIFEICLEIIFSTVHANFQKPITEKEQVIGKLVSGILFHAKAMHSARQSGKTSSVVMYLQHQIANEIDNEILNNMLCELDETTKDK